MANSTVQISPAGRIVCIHTLDSKIRELSGQLQYYLTTTAGQYVDLDWVQQQELLIATLTADLNHLRND